MDNEIVIIDFKIVWRFIINKSIFQWILLQKYKWEKVLFNVMPSDINLKITVFDVGYGKNITFFVKVISDISINKIVASIFFDDAIYIHR